jgi:hypothetical protein
MTSWRSRTARQASALANTLALVLGTVALGSAGCGADEREEIAAITSALGSIKTQQTIGNWTQLTQMASDGNYLLTANLTAMGAWTAKDFTGTFDGGGKTITNLTVNGAGSGAGFFKSIQNGIVRNVRFINLTVTDNFAAGGVAGTADNSLIENVGVEGTINAQGAMVAGGLVGMGGGTTFSRCYMKGSVTGAVFDIGGIIGYLGGGISHGLIRESYTWATVTGNTSDGGHTVAAGGIVGLVSAAFVQEVYAVGNVTGRGAVGGLVGDLQCDESNQFVLNHGVFRGDAIDKNWTPSGGWAGTFGTFSPCWSRFDQLIWDRTHDGSTHFGVSGDAQKSATNQELMSPTTPGGGVFSYQDNLFGSDFWAPGTANQHHALKNMPGGLTIQPRCVNGSGVPFAC